MTAKEKQTYFIKTYLKPTLKTFGYQTIGQTWWKDKGDFFTLINLHNFSWNSKDRVDFLFQYWCCFKSDNERHGQKKPTVYDLTVGLRESSYLPDNRLEHKFRNKTGYLLTEETELNDFS